MSRTAMENYIIQTGRGGKFYNREKKTATENWIDSRVEMREQILERRRKEIEEKEYQKQLEEYVEKKLGDIIEKELSKLLKGLI